MNLKEFLQKIKDITVTFPEDFDFQEMWIAVEKTIKIWRHLSGYQEEEK